MATSANLPLGGFITTLDGKRCTAVPRTDVSTQSSTTSTFSSFFTSSTSASQVLAPPAVQTTAQQTTTPPPPPAVATTSSASTGQFSIIASTPEAVSPAAAQPQLQSSVADTSVAASSTAALATPLVATTSQVTATATTLSALLQTDTQSAAQLTTIGTASGQATSSPEAQNAATSTATAVAASGISSGSRSNRSAVAVAGGVIGGVALVSLVALFIWFWRRRAMRKRRSTLLTPLSAEPGPGYLRGKRGDSLRRDSMGPAPRTGKVKAALRAQYGRVRGHLGTLSRSASIHSTASHTSGRSVDMNRGNSQFMDTSPVIAHERKASSAFSSTDDSDMTIKERILELWARFTGGSRNQEPTYNEKNDIFAARGISGDTKKGPTAGSRRLTNKPDFLTLLNMDDSELDREAQRRRFSRTRGLSEGSGLGGLDLNFGPDPFSDANAISRNTPNPTPFVVSGANNPFSDANAIAGPTGPSTYIQDIRRSRGQSVDASTIDLNKIYDLQGLHIVNESSRPPSGSTAAGPHGSTFYFRDSQVSAASFESFATKRNKFRSDPFDLEPVSGSLGSPMGSIPGLPSGIYSPAGPGTPSRPPAAHTRRPSDGSSSKYTSGLSNGTLDDWSDPGPDVGSAARRPSMYMGSAL